MASWPSDGQVFGYDASSASPQPIYYLSTNAVVDPASASGVTGAITRMQYNKSGSAFQYNRVYAQGVFQYASSDFTNNVGKILTVSAFFAPATLFAPNYVPTANEILSKGPSLTVYRASTGLSSTSSSGYPYVNYVFRGPWANQLQPNSKYWLLIVPTAVTNMASTPSYANDIPIYPNGRSLARGISLWSNRTPKAPTITSPVSGAIYNSNATGTFTFTASDNDSIVGAPANQAYRYGDVAGVQVQYAAKPVPGGPAQVWTDVTIMATSGSVSGNGWYIDGSSANGTNPGALTLWRNFTIPMAFGSLTPGVGAMAIPAGDWQLRMRTFDYGHPYGGSGELPLFTTAANLIPSKYPAVNTSPWSDPINISITAQVPPPTPLYPINDTAIAKNLAVTLSWQYRNTYTPPYAQAARQIQMRKLGDATWTTVVSDTSADPGGSLSSWTVTGFPMAATNCYEWRVQVADTTNSASNWSPIGRFWIVEVPGSGSTFSNPSSTIDGATLGCGTHRVEVYRRGGTKRLGELRGITHVDWARVRDDISNAQVVVKDWDIDCGNLLSILQTWAYELVIYRTTWYGTERVWEGPITKLTYETDKVTIDAKDVMAYTYRRIIKQKMTSSGETIVARAARILQTFLAPDDPNILANLQILSRSDDATTLRSTIAWSRTVFEEIDDMAANAGLDYTAVGRAILLWGTKHRIGTLPEFRDSDLGSSPIVSEYGMSAANVYSVTDGNGIHGEAYRGGITADNGYIDPVYGLIEILSSSWSSDSTSDTGTYTAEEAAKLKTTFEGYAERSIADRYTPPVIVRLPDGTSINPDAVISIQQLVPGVLIPLRSTGTLRTVMSNQKLDSVKVVEESGKETISITMSPFNSDDASLDTEA